VNTAGFLSAVLTGEGYLCVPVGTGGHFDDGKYVFDDFTQHWFAWPTQKADAVGFISAAAGDAYFCPYLLKDKSRTVGNAVTRQLVHADVDHPVDEQQVRDDLGGGAVASGSDGHTHVYIPLTYAVTQEQHRTLCAGLRDSLGGDDKIADNDLLRPAGSLNRKSDPPGEVRVLWWPDQPVDPRELADKIGVDITSVTADQEKGSRALKASSDPGTPVDLDQFPAVKEALAEKTADRSADTFRIVGVCYRSGLSTDQSRWVVRTREDLRARLDGRRDDDVAAAWHKVDEQERAVERLVPQPPSPPPGDVVLDRLAAWFNRFICFTDPDDADLLALWCAHTYLAVELYTSPRLQVDSTVPESGKTTVLEHLDHLAHNPVQAATLTSSALIPRLLESGLVTFLIDEVDRTLAPGKPGIEDLLAVLNSGYKVGARRPVLEPVKGGGWEVSHMSTFAPVAMAGNAPQLPDDTRSRNIRVLLMPDLHGEVEDSDWELITDDAEVLQGDLARWADSVREKVKGLKVDLPDGCVRRSREKWRPLMRVAVTAGGRWPGVAEGLIVRSVNEDAAMREAGLKERPPRMVMLEDLRHVWPDDAPFMATRDLVLRLIAENPDYWGADSAYGRQLTETRCSKMLAQAAKLTSTRLAHGGPRGFLRRQLEPVWHRLGITPISSGSPGSPGSPGSSDAKSDEVNQDNRDNQENQEKTDPPVVPVDAADYPPCSGGCGLPIGPVDAANGRTHHGLCA
jgi:hypothetical protein